MGGLFVRGGGGRRGVEQGGWGFCRWVGRSRKLKWGGGRGWGGGGGVALRLFLSDPCYGLKVIADAFLVNAYQKYTC